MDISIFNWGFTLDPIFFILIFWTLAWKGIALWKTGRNNQPIWFVTILIFNTAGILPIVYLLFFQREKTSKKRKVTRKTIKKR